MSSATSRIILGLFAGGAGFGAAHADRPEYGAFMDIQQIAEAQLHGPGADDVTYTEISGNIVAQISNRRIVATGTYRLGYRIPELGDADKSQAVPSTANRGTTTLKALCRDFTSPPMSIVSLILAALMLIAGVLLLIDAPALGPLMGGMVFGSAILLVLFAIFGPFLW